MIDSTNPLAAMTFASAQPSNRIFGRRSCKIEYLFRSNPSDQSIASEYFTGVCLSSIRQCRFLLLRRLRADRLSSAVAHDGEFVRPGLSAQREPQSQPYPDTERRARRKPKNQNDTGPGREQGLFGRNK